MDNLPDPQLTIEMTSDLNIFMTTPGIPGFNGFGSGMTAEASFNDLLEDLQSYCRIWKTELATASNHAAAEPVANWVTQATERDIRAWLINSEQPFL